MQKVNIFDIEGTEFPAGRRTRVIIGDNGAIKGEHFCQGYVVIYPGGSIPLHDHPTVESYTILEGNGEVTIGDETQAVRQYDVVFMEHDVPHMLKNTGESELRLMFVYAPKIVVDHWDKELSGEIK